jgi:hypothetical protein
MQIRWPFQSRSPESTSKPNLTAASESLFRPTPIAPLSVARAAGQPLQAGLYAKYRNQAPYARTWIADDLKLSHADIPALTITSGPSGEICLVGGKRDEWSLGLSAVGEGDSEAEALQVAKAASLVVSGATVNLRGPGAHRAQSQLIVEAPDDAQATIHASFAPVTVRNMSGPVRVTAIRARATILNTSGQVDACAPMIDFAACEGQVILSAEWDINLKFISDSFKGQLTAWAQHSVRVLIPETFRSAFQVLVNRPQDFVCRAKFREGLRQEQRGGLVAFSFAGDGTTSPESIHLRSEHAQIIIDGL